MEAFEEICRFLRIHGFDSRIERKDSQKGIFVSLTTTSDRIQRIRPTLISLMNQTVQPECIFLNIPELTRDGQPFPVPDFIEQMELVKINKIPSDLGPITKLIPSLNNDTIAENDLIIVVDDDQIYPKGLIAHYLSKAMKYPKEALTLCGWTAPESLRHSDKLILRGAGLKLVNPNPNILQDQLVDVVQGASSYLVRKNYFNSEFQDFSGVPDQVLFADDIWVSGHLARQNISKRVVLSPFAYCRIQSLTHFSSKGLRDTRNADNSNNDFLYSFFKKDWNY